MNWLIPAFILLPFIGFLLILLAKEKQERLISRIAYTALSIQLAAVSIFALLWLVQGAHPINIKEFVLYKTEGYEFYIDLFFDKISLVYLLVGAFLSFLVTIYSRHYLHRESGFKRFFSTIMIFYTGYNLTILSGNLETLFVGWEILGISSFLLIAFYRERYLPVKNAIKVFSIYRIGDVGIILAMWMTHHFWHENITFLKLSNYELVSEHLTQHSGIGLFISLMILLAAAAKSAQLPFSSWLPRAMEGPTPSSAIFYGSLSVHIGIFLLLRTFPFWEHQITMRVITGCLGLITAIFASSSARVQSSVKAQVAYSSVAQIGLIFIEIALGFENIALIHFAGNAFLRTYQLLVSPSIVTYLIRDQFYNFQATERKHLNALHKKIDYTMYVWSLKEWNLDSFLYSTLWKPLKIVGDKLSFLNVKVLSFLILPVYALATVLILSSAVDISPIAPYLPVSFSFIGLLLVLKSFTERKSVQTAWLLVISNHFWTAIAVSFNDQFNNMDIILYLAGIVVAGIVGSVIIQVLKQRGLAVNLTRMHGYVHQHPKLAALFLLASLGVAGFPITTTFLGEDLIFSHIHQNQIILAAIISLGFIIDGLALIRIYARIFLGPQERSYQNSSKLF
jgi:NADH:ubiquinone oxidoreductase subunit 5 (subunit L)/multisubunit Na+/H+ antiporter MnhA subunit